MIHILSLIFDVRYKQKMIFCVNPQRGIIIGASNKLSYFIF